MFSSLTGRAGSGRGSPRTSHNSARKSCEFACSEPPETFQRAMKSVMLVMRSKACVWWLEDGDYDMARSTLGVCPDVRGKRSFAPTTVIARSKATRQSRSVYLARSALDRDLPECAGRMAIRPLANSRSTFIPDPSRWPCRQTHPVRRPRWALPRTARAA